MKRFFLISLFSFFIFSFVNAQEEKYIGLFIYNFTKYFDWPADTKSGDFKIQVLGHSSVGDELKTITSGKTVGNQRIVIEQINAPEQINPSAHILFLGHWQIRHLESIKQKISGNPILLVTEFEGLLQKGATINFIIREGRIMFELNNTNAEAAGLQIDLRLKELAYSVVE